MPHHGEIDSTTNKIFCSYWMTFDEWEEIHNYGVGIPEQTSKDETATQAEKLKDKKDNSEDEQIEEDEQEMI
jgi:hypothetical protein